MAYADLSKTIEIVMSYVTKGTGQAYSAANAMNKKINNMYNSQEFPTKGIAQSMNRIKTVTGLGTGQINEMLEKLGYSIQSNGTFTRKGVRGFQTYGKTASDVAKKHKELYGSTKRFKYEFLGLMFAGMNMKKMFAGYINQVDSWMGFSELFTTGLSLLALDAIEPLTDTIYDLADAIFGLQGTTAGKMVGWGIVVGSAFGDVLFQASAAVLAISSFKMAFPATAAWIGGSIMKIATAVTAVISGSVLAMAFIIGGLTIIVATLLGVFDPLWKLKDEIGGWGNMGASLGWGSWDENAYQSAQKNQGSGGTTLIAPNISYVQAPGAASMSAFEEHKFQNVVEGGLIDVFSTNSRRTG